MINIEFEKYTDIVVQLNKLSLNHSEAGSEYNSSYYILLILVENKSNIFKIKSDLRSLLSLIRIYTNFFDESGSKNVNHSLSSSGPALHWDGTNGTYGTIGIQVRLKPL